MINWNNIDHFKEHEFECKCGCGICNPHQKLVFMLDHARSILKQKIVLLSACRCKYWNEHEGGKIDSAHIASELKPSYAVDIRYNGNRHKFLLVDALIKAGFNRLGIYKRFIHADIDPTKPSNVMW